MAYQALVQPQLEYASVVWNPYTAQNIKKLEQVQRRAIRWVKHDYSRFSSVSTMQHELGWRTLENRRADARLILFYKIITNQIAIPIPHYLQTPLRYSRHQNSRSFIQVHSNTLAFQNSFFPWSVKLWNKLPEEIVNTSELDVFKTQVSKIAHTT